MWHIPDLLRKIIDDGFFTDGIFDFRDELSERSCFTFAKIENIEKIAFIINCALNPLYDVIDVGVVPLGGAVAKLIDGNPVIDFASELVNGEIRSLARSVNRKKAQANHSNAI